MKDHELKCWPVFFGDTITGIKEFQYLRDDRGFQQGDALWLREWDVVNKKYTGRNVRVLVQRVWKNIPGVRKRRKSKRSNQ